MEMRGFAVLAGILIPAGIAAFVSVAIPAQEASAVSDPRQEPPVVTRVRVARATGFERGFAGLAGPRAESDPGFGIAGKIMGRLVNVGPQVEAGQPLMPIDETDPRLALAAKCNAVAAATDE